MIEIKGNAGQEILSGAAFKGVKKEKSRAEQF